MFKVERPSVFPSLLSAPPLSPAATWMLSEQQYLIQPHVLRTGPAFTFEWGHTHTYTATSPLGSLAENQKCKAMFWLGSSTCSQGSPNHGRRGRGDKFGVLLYSSLLTAFFLSLSCLAFDSYFSFLLMLFHPIIPLLK